MTDQELIEGLTRHDRNAIHRLVGDYQEKIIKTAFSFLRNMEDAEELSQDILIDVIDSAASFRKQASLSTWIYRITVNRSLNLIRKNKRKQMFRSLEEHLHLKRSDADPHEDLASTHLTRTEEGEKRKLLDKAVHSLPQNQRIAFILSKYEELPYKEIAEVMNLSHSSVESLIHRAKLNLQVRLAAHFSEYKKN